MRCAIMLAAAFALSACARPVSESDKARVENGFQVAKLFTHDGCTVYRFYDEGRSRYYVNCNGATLADHTVYCGKSCLSTQTDEITTRLEGYP